MLLSGCFPARQNLEGVECDERGCGPGLYCVLGRCQRDPPPDAGLINNLLAIGNMEAGMNLGWEPIGGALLKSDPRNVSPTRSLGVAMGPPRADGGDLFGVGLERTVLRFTSDAGYCADAWVMPLNVPDGVRFVIKKWRDNVRFLESDPASTAASAPSSEWTRLSTHVFVEYLYRDAITLELTSPVTDGGAFLVDDVRFWLGTEDGGCGG